MRRRLGKLLLTIAVALLAAGAAEGVPKAQPRAGGTFRIVTTDLDSIDPATSIYAWSELSATCVHLMAYTDKPLHGGLRLAPEIAAAWPKVSRDGTTYTFTIRPGFRFSTGERVSAASFAHEINRILDPALQSPWSVYVQDIVGAQEVLDGKATQASGLVALGNKLVVHLTEDARDFPARTSIAPFCAVPIGLPASPDLGSSLPGAGPYYIADYVPGRKLILQRNRFYHGSRPHHVAGFTVEFVDSAQSALSEVMAGKADWADSGAASDYAGLIGKYKLNHSQLYRFASSAVRYVALNTSRPLFRNNAGLRRAINFAIDRPALLRERGGPETGQLTDQYLSPSMPGFRDAQIYPLHGPNLSKANALARGHTRSGQAVLYIQDRGPSVPQAQILQDNLRRIGITVVIKSFPGPAYFEKIFTPGEPYDMALVGSGPDYLDPYAVLNTFFDGRQIRKPGSNNFARFNSPRYNRLLARASRLTGAARYRAYGRLDIDIARNAAPLAAYEAESVFNFVSKRASCLVFNPFLDITPVCLK
ncbi:MAG TPA: ABC transporter substrate-binding protein [Gaiellaceae bacterium]|jgi:peptide/nickel transport system substrate-binding protein